MGALREDLAGGLAAQPREPPLSDSAGNVQARSSLAYFDGSLIPKDPIVRFTLTNVGHLKQVMILVSRSVILGDDYRYVNSEVGRKTCTHGSG